jgi:hypothetical protein
LTAKMGASAAGVHPDYIGIGPVPAMNRVLVRVGWRMDDVDLIEIKCIGVGQGVTLGSGLAARRMVSAAGTVVTVARSALRHGQYRGTVGIAVRPATRHGSGPGARSAWHGQCPRGLSRVAGPQRAPR